MEDQKKFALLKKAPSLKNQLIKLYQEFGKGSTIEDLAKREGLTPSHMLRLVFMGDHYLTMEENDKK